MESPTQSPTSNPTSEQTTASFPEAIQAIISGRKVTKLEWDDKNIYGVLADKYLSIHREGRLHRWLVSEEDMMGSDWIVLPEGN